MNFERGFSIPQHKNSDSWNSVNRGMPIPHERPIPMDNGAVRGQESRIPTNREQVKVIPVGNGIVDYRNGWNTTTERTILQGDRVVQNMNGIGQSGNSWTPVTPEKLMNDRSNAIPVGIQTTQSETENWEDLIGMYTGFLKDEKVVTNGMVEDINHTPPTVVHGNGHRNWVPTPGPYRNHNSTQQSTPLPYFNTNDPANWKANHLASVLSSNRSSRFVSSANEAQNNGIHASNGPSIPSPPTQAESNGMRMRSTSWSSMLGIQQTQQFTPNNAINSGGQVPKDGFPVAYQPRYNPNSPPRSEPTASSSTIINSFPFSPITPNNPIKHMGIQHLQENVDFPLSDTSTPTKDIQGNQTVSIKDAENLYNNLLQTIEDSPTSEISTTQKENGITENKEEQVVDLNQTPQQKTPVRRKKHRPKVIRELKPKKTPKPKDPTNGTPSETRVKRKYVKKKGVNVDGVNEKTPVGSVVKRKYVRKKGVDKFESQQKNKEDDVVVKSCKKQLNFDLEEVAQDESHDIRSKQQDTEQAINVPTTPTGNTRLNALNVLARTMSTSSRGNKLENAHNNANQHFREEGIEKIIFQSGVGPANYKRVQQPNYISTPESFDDRRGVKRPINAMDSIFLYKKMLLGVAHRSYDHNNLKNILLENHKKMKMQSIADIEDNSRQINGVYGNVSAMQLWNSCTNKAMNFNNNRQFQLPPIPQKYNQGNVTAIISWNPHPPTPPKVLHGYAVANSNSNSYKEKLNGFNEMIKKQSTMAKGGIGVGVKRGRKAKVKGEVSVDDVMYKFERLRICDENKKGENELVVYNGGGNEIIPFEAVKKRVPRPKVDLDPETDRLWNLLMGKEGSEGGESLDKDKEKWWENERKVFRGRADSFIARMHLVQGDRRFSRWKGSVVDSVIGVFLTQNVSDHLSSSAFMALAAKFPIKSSPTNKTCCKEGACEGNIQVVEPDDIIKCHETIKKQLIPDQNIFVSSESSEIIITETNNDQKILEEEVVLSQDSNNSSIIQTVDEIRSSSGSNSEAEDAATGPLNIVQNDKPKANIQIPAMNEFDLNRTVNCFKNTATEASSKEQKAFKEPPNMPKSKKAVAEEERNIALDWDSLRKEALLNSDKKERSNDAADSLDYEALRNAHVNEISDAIRERGMNNLLADRMKDFLNRLVRDHGKVDLEWLRDAPPDKAKEYLLSFRGLGLKSVECVRLLTLHHMAFPVDTNVGRIAVRLGWVPLQPLPESLQLHLLEMYPVLESIQKYLWPRLCKMDQLTLYELHYQMITFGKVFCTKSKPNCNACPMRGECRHFASAFASARLSLPGPEEKRIVTTDTPVAKDPIPPVFIKPMQLPEPENDNNKTPGSFVKNCEPIIEEPTTPEPETVELSISDIEDQYYEDSDDIPTIKLNMEEFTTNLQNIMQDSMEDDMSKALVALNPKAASIPTPKLKDVSRLRTEHLVYELPDSHQLLEGLDKREPDDPSPYLLAIWTPGETANSVQAPEVECSAQESGKLCDRTTCFSCNNVKEANSQVVRGTILIPCRTAMRGSFPLNGTYFQVNEMFADHASSLNPIDVPRAWIWNLPRRTVYFGTSVSTIFKGLSTEGIQYCFWKGFVCVRGFERKTRCPRPLMARLHFPASKLVKAKNEGK